MLDFTHGTNASKYKLFSFMIDDVFGHGQYVQHALVENESHACMKDAIAAFKENNPMWDRIRAIMIDKDFGEMNLLKREFPLARVLICHFHLKKYLRTEMAKTVYGGRDAVDVDRVEDAVDMMAKTQDEAEYDRGLRYMYYILDGFDEQKKLPEPKHSLLVYFIRNWHSCKDMWTVYERDHVAHLGNHTNNRLESAWGDLKFARASMNKKKLIPINYIHPRWLLQSDANRPESDESDDDVSCSVFRVQCSNMRSAEHAILSGSTKWKTAMDIAERVVEAMNSQEMRTFLDMAQALRDFGECVSQGVVPTVGTADRETDHTLKHPANADSEDESNESSAREVVLSDESTVPPTLKTSDDFESPTAESEQLIAKTDRSVRRVRDIISSNSESDEPQSTQLKSPVKPSKTCNSAAKALRRKDVTAKLKKGNNTSVKATKDMQSKPLSKYDTNQSNKLGNVTNEIGGNVEHR